MNVLVYDCKYIKKWLKYVQHAHEKFTNMGLCEVENFRVHYKQANTCFLRNKEGVIYIKCAPKFGLCGFML